jgi:gas vesicle protein
MSHTLIGVLIGGAIGSVAPVATLLFNHLHWKREAKLTHLKQERQRLEELCEKNLKRFAIAMDENLYPTDMTTDMAVSMPKEIFDVYDKYMLKRDQSVQAKKSAYLDVALAMKKALAEVDGRINEIAS